MGKANNANDEKAAKPDSTAVRVALWRATHVQVDAPPHVLVDEIGLRIADPGAGWRDRPDMHPQGTSTFRASIVARARYLDDLVCEQVERGISQYVLLGAGLDTFAQRRPEVASKMHVFEVDQPGPQAWKQRRLAELGLPVPGWLRFVPIDFEVESWRAPLLAAGFDSSKPAVVASTGVSMYLTRDANIATLRDVAAFAKGSTLAMSFLLPLDLADLAVRPGLQRAVERARASGTPFLSFFTPSEIVTLALEAGFRDVRHISAAVLTDRYFANRPDGLRPPSNAEELLVATT